MPREPGPLPRNKVPPNPGEIWGYQETVMIIEMGDFNDTKTGIHITITYPASTDWPEYKKLQPLDDGLLPCDWHKLNNDQVNKIRRAVIK